MFSHCSQIKGKQSSNFILFNNIISYSKLFLKSVVLKCYCSKLSLCYLEFWTSQCLLCLKVNNQYRKEEEKKTRKLLNMPSWLPDVHLNGMSVVFLDIFFICSSSWVLPWISHYSPSVYCPTHSVGSLSFN